MTTLGVGQRLLLAKYLTEGLAAARKADMLPQAAAEMPPGTRMPVFFAGRQAGWASMPQPSKKAAYVSDEKALLAWAEIHYPEKVGTAEAVDITDDVLALVAEHLPGAIIRTRRPDPQWVSDVQVGLRDRGYYVSAKGEKLASVPGITVPEPDPPVPHVTLADDAEQVIGGAWQAGEIPVTDLLSLPAPNGTAA